MRDFCPHCHQLTRQFQCIAFSPEDMQVKNIKYNRPLYYTGHVRSTKVNCIQIDPELALSIIPRKLMQLLGILLHRQTPTNTTIFGFNANDSNSLEKIRLWCQIGDLKAEVMCYVNDANMPYNILLGWPWINANMISPINPPQLHEVLWWRKRSPDIDHEQTIFQRSKKLFYGYLPISGRPRGPQ